MVTATACPFTRISRGSSTTSVSLRSPRPTPSMRRTLRLSVTLPTGDQSDHDGLGHRSVGSFRDMIKGTSGLVSG